MFDRICLWSHFVLDFCFLGVLQSLFQFQYLRLVCSYFLFLLGLSLLRLYLSKDLSIYSRWSILLDIVSIIQSPLKFCRQPIRVCLLCLALSFLGKTQWSLRPRLSPASCFSLTKSGTSSCGPAWYGGPPYLRKSFLLSMALASWCHHLDTSKD